MTDHRANEIAKEAGFDCSNFDCPPTYVDNGFRLIITARSNARALPTDEEESVYMGEFILAKKGE